MHHGQYHPDRNTSEFVLNTLRIECIVSLNTETYSYAREGSAVATNDSSGSYALSPHRPHALTINPALQIR